MGKFELFNQIRSASRKSDVSVSNVAALGLPVDTGALHILWMYSDVLEMHGSRGDAMGLLHCSNLMALPCEIRKCVNLTDEIPFDWADMMLFPSGDLACMADVSCALRRHEAEFRAFQEAGKVIVAVASTGAVLAKKLTYRDGSSSEGLGLLDMEMTQRETVFGDDLWFETKDGLRIMGNEIQMADTKLLPGQEPFGKVLYGRGNCGDGWEGARKGNVIFTHATGPVFAKNPRFTAYILKLAASVAGMDVSGYQLRDEDISLENQSLQEIEGFIRQKLDGKIH